MINVAVAGIGSWGKNVVRNFEEIETANLVACYDSNDTALTWVRQRYPGVRVTGEYEKILSQEDIDAVIIVTPASTHFDLAKKALEAEKHVLIEKPLTLNSQEGELLIELAQKKGKKMMVGHLLKYHPAVLEMRKRIERDELGNIYYFHSQRLSLGRIRNVENVMWCLATHDIYCAVYLLGKQPEKVSAFGQSFFQRGKGIEDVVFLNLFFDDGVFAHIHASWCEAEKVRQMKIVGKKGTMVFDELNSSCKLKIYDRSIMVRESAGQTSFDVREGKLITHPVEDKKPLREECSHFIDCLKEDKVPFTDGEEGLRVVKILEAAKNSLKRGMTVKVAP